jgi:NAD(P)-dependent dehydrogenase (short-subunit alcohol dehydrogenase family)
VVEVGADKPAGKDGQTIMEDLFSLKGKNIVIAGGGGGIGRGLAAGFVKYGASVGIAEVDRASMESAMADIEASTGKKITGYWVDRTNDQEDNVRDILARALADMGRVHVLVNAQGFNVKAAATDFPTADWDTLFHVNVRGVMLFCKHFGAHMVEQGGGKIINLSSIRGERGALGGNLGYCSTKGAVNMLTKQLAVEFAPKNVLVNALGPIITLTPMTEATVKREPQRYERVLNNIPMGRMGRVDDLIGPAVFLASAASDFVTGTILYPDGGTMAFV